MPKDLCGEEPRESLLLTCAKCHVTKSSPDFREGAPDGRSLKICGQCRTKNNEQRKRKADEDKSRRDARRNRTVLGSLSTNTNLRPTTCAVQNSVAPAVTQAVRTLPDAYRPRQIFAQPEPSSLPLPPATQIAQERHTPAWRFQDLDGSVGDPPLFVEPAVRRPAREKQFPALISNGIHPETHDLGRADLLCPKCNACHWRDELGQRGSKKDPALYKFPLCCSDGKHIYASPPEPPARLKELFTADTVEAKAFRKHVLKYNNALAFTSCKYKEDQRLAGSGGIKSFSVHGELQHYHGRIDPNMMTPAPGFAQCIFYDPDEAAEFRHSRCPDLNKSLLKELDEIMRACNANCQIYINAYQYIADLDQQYADRTVQLGSVPERLPNTWVTLNARMGLTVREGADLRRENCPIIKEFAGLIPDVGSPITSREIVLISRTDVDESHRLDVIKSTHPGYFPLHYVLLYPCGRGGWTALSDDERSAALARWGRFSLHFRPDDNSLLHYSARLLQKFAVDLWCSHEQNNLEWIEKNQSSMKLFQFKEVQDALETDQDLSDKGTFVYLGPSHIGSPRHMQQCYQDSMAIVRRFGRPSLFVTMTCNPGWKEIQDELKPGQTAADRPDLITRVFELKKKALLKDLRTTIGGFLGNVWTIEYQKRGLPHIHILLFLASEDSFLERGRIDEVVSAELPRPEQDPTGLLRPLIESQLIHGPCGRLNPDSPCMKKGKDGIARCSKGFPKQFQEQTIVEDDGYPLYQRRNNGERCLKRVHGKDVYLDNRWVVPHNPWLVKKYAAHINTEVCSSVRAVKYIHKYIYKGEDLQTAELKNGKNEVTQYIHSRYVSPSSAIFRMLAYHTHEEYPSVMKLHVHLDGEQIMCMKEAAEQAGTRFDPNTKVKSTLLDWFVYNQTNEDGRDIVYQDFPAMHVYKKEGTEYGWHPRKSGTPAIGRMVMCYLSQGEKYFLRLLLSRVPGATGYEYLRTVNGQIYPTFQQACLALGLITDDNDASMFFGELARTESGWLQRVAFVSVLVHNRPVNPAQLWLDHRTDLCDDLKRALERARVVLPPIEEPIFDYGLHLVELLLQKHGKTLADFHLPPVRADWTGTTLEDGLAPVEELWDRSEQTAQAETMIPQLNDGQRAAFEQICAGIAQTPTQANFFVHGPAGTGKTFLYKCICAHYRGQGKTVLCVASSGVAALLLPGGTTSHSRFKIPIDCLPTSTCAIANNSETAALMRRTDLIIWDKVPMQHKHNFAAVDRTLRALTGHDVFFGSIPTIFGGDFAQTTPVVPRGNRAAQVMASIRMAPWWPILKVLRLTVNMRMQPGLDNHLYKRWIGAMSYDKQLYEHVRLPPQIERVFSSLDLFVTSIFDFGRLKSCTDSADNYRTCMDYFRSRAILAPHNATVDSINGYILQHLGGDSTCYYATDKISNDMHESWGAPAEVLNILNPAGLPQSRLELRLGSPIVILRNLDPSLGICNGTRAIVIGLRERSIKIRIVGTEFEGSEYNLFRVSLSSSKGLPFEITRTQFPIRLAFAMTVNKSQGQSLEHVGLDLTHACFAHGQLYVGLSRVKSARNLSVHITDVEARTTPNIVYPEVLLPEDVADQTWTS